MDHQIIEQNPDCGSEVIVIGWLVCDFQPNSNNLFKNCHLCKNKQSVTKVVFIEHLQNIC